MESDVRVSPRDLILYNKFHKTKTTISPRSFSVKREKEPQPAFIYLCSKKAQTVIIPVLSFSFAGIDFPAVNGLRDWAEVPGDAPLTVEFLLSLLAQFLLGDKLRHEHHLLPVGVA